MTVVYRAPEGDDGLEFTVRLTPEETRVLTREVRLLAEIVDSCLWALGMLRTGVNSRDAGRPAPIPGDWYSALRDLERIAPRVEGTRDAVIRALAESGEGTGRLAHALHTDEEAASRRRAAVLGNPPSDWETWAAKGVAE
ncbi:hypothetical protein DMB38_04605 [Streptomyces sp. WAC 06738]|jgi:hypothetical protein|uniref:hypothetical protein n=1 Tax=Streptomyces sp. WAC 06738 TaxID=2203210 RepID=UPI000F6E9409|nr:hypothetical protein [Streptomyces sp. WAC 06738]AZM45204.1 hypothetical protein DMB38_04605 [Streptomyces sp. WAC 06738]